ncbi:MAG: iron chelate uptake ABC transporter family permease subunit [Corynebacterium sp.]|uniref:ABC transporter permease n=1 Tax=Corynebacterium sp. TaxID=1720 RepID=UPI0026474BD5|nr:iron chelate uptake ABC transporter family permease subunit [Corynebacterium sp.]MDN6282854.1 iron chelate uptake ABC transporter family permease subunit [Corynebacterium sp.]MDN6305612.1 iron chelate uptake ABC transporter family permease subunit [Corynebacterium sp.]MDN6368407.1 iron chelate uptake ABC transporter family permease subunit [Corynebacterium sp.]
MTSAPPVPQEKESPPPAPPPNPSWWRTTWPILIGILITIGLIIASLFIGVYDITGAEDGWRMFGITRIPRTIALALAGAAMAMCGLVMQLLTQNKFVEPTTTGTTEWAGLGLILTMVMIPGASLFTRMVGAIIFALAGTIVFFLFLQRVTLKSSLIVPIVGIMLGAVVGSVSTYVALQTEMLQQLGIWFAGSFTGIVRGRYELLFIVLVVLILIFIVADRFTVAGLGKDIATSVGLNYRQVLFVGIMMIAVVTGVVTVVVGNLPFLGLIVPNIVSMFRGDNLRSNLPWVAMLGMWILIICDIIARTVIMPFEVPVSLILGILGAIVFVMLLVRSRRYAR